MVRSGMRWDLAKARSQRGCGSTSGANFTAVRRSMRSGIGGLPQSRPLENDQSRVAMSALAPAALARSMRCVMESRLPIQYIW